MYQILICKSWGCLLIMNLLCTGGNLEIDGHPSKQNIFGQSALLIDTMCIGIKKNNFISTNSLILLATRFAYYSVHIIKPF